MLFSENIVSNYCIEPNKKLRIHFIASQNLKKISVFYLLFRFQSLFQLVAQVLLQVITVYFGQNFGNVLAFLLHHNFTMKLKKVS